MDPIRGFASDNCSGVHPAMLAAIERVNRGHAGSYGADPETGRLEELARAEFGPDAVIFPMLNGTGANVAALRAIARPHQAVICVETAHLAIDETAAPEAIAGVKLLTVSTPDGKLTPELAATRLADPADLPHVAWPAAISIAQPTEVGTVYTVEEVKALAGFAREHGLAFHMDGSRLANAAASLGTTLAGTSLALGVDVLCLGANKNGALFGEAVIFARPEAAQGFEVLRKGSLQLASKMRFLSAQLVAQLEGELWRELAGEANRMARALADGITWIEGADLGQPVEANIVFLAVETEAGRKLAAGLEPHSPLVFPAGDAVVLRLVTSWDTTIEDVDGLLARISESLT